MSRACKAFLFATVLLSLIGGCSLLIDADTGKLGGADLGGGSTAGSSNGATGSDAGPVACAAGCPSGERCSSVQGCIPIACRTDADCDDGNGCSGSETCKPNTQGADPQTGCVPGTTKRCDDGINCTIDSCDPVKDCVHTPNDTFCSDGIACTKDTCLANAMPGTDGCTRTPDNTRCDFCHADGVCAPGAGGCVGKVPTNCSDGDGCTADSCDDAKSMCINGPRDDDKDGVSPIACGGSDCNDNNASIHPGAPEICDREDDNCNRMVDEGCSKLPDKCDSRQLLTLVSGRAEVSGALSDFASNYGTSCGENGGLDAVYAIPISGPSDIVIDSEGSDARVVLALAENCVDNAFTLGCSGDISRNVDRSRLMVHRYTPSSPNALLFLLIDGATSAERGAFNVSIEVKPAASDSCASVVFDAGSGGTVIGFVSGALSQQSGSCQSALALTASETIVQVNAPEDGSLEVSVDSDNFKPTLYARESCAEPKTELDCDAASGNSGPGSGQNGRAALSFEAKPGSDVFLLVDGAGVFSGGRYVLKYTP